jgi:hypothetical protein
MFFMSLKKIILALCFFPIIGTAKTFELNENGPDIKVPIAIWNLFGNVEGKDTISFSAIKVRLVEKTSGVLVDPEVEIQLPRGGGTIDLSQFVRNQQGTFSVFFDLDEMNDEKQLQAFFVSHARKRKIDGEVWGAGCHTYLDIKKFVLGDAKKTGIVVNTTRNRHDSVLGGTFFFSMGHQVTQVTFTDSQQSQLFCDAAQGK